MNSIGRALAASAMSLTLSNCPQVSWADGFTGSEFLEWSKADQTAYINSQVVMASTIVTRAKPEMARCMADKFYSETGLTEAQLNDFIANVEQYSSYHPSTVLVLLIEAACGKFY